MTKFHATLRLLIIVCFTLIGASLAQAQATRTWVSGVGDDANPCSRTAPCKTFAGAISKTATGGEISALDPGGFGAVTITKSITINGDGTLAGILAASTNGIIVNVPTTDTVIIRSLSINGSMGASIGLNGIRFIGGRHLHVENCSIYGFSNRGIDAVVTTGTAELTVVNTSITNAGVAIRAEAQGGSTINAEIHNCRMQRGVTGVDAVTGSKVVVSDSVITNNTSFGLQSEGNATELNAVNNKITHNTVGVTASTSGATVRLNNNDIYLNPTQLSIAAGGTIGSYGNNKIFPLSVQVPNATLTPQ